eukprot:TRINITY_DN1648_c7_g1_i1.p2 TRINITY_DN1648_c7_g1~~TRINITY_DN1648_c7_g1_i1.p2  ORF type:complete len:119 (-),score=11.98 TRINITY_DN1648_c7_g1_i1:388-744(-)
MAAAACTNAASECSDRGRASATTTSIMKNRRAECRELLADGDGSRYVQRRSAVAPAAHWCDLSARKIWALLQPTVHPSRAAHRVDGGRLRWSSWFLPVASACGATWPRPVQCDHPVEG